MEKNIKITQIYEFTTGDCGVCDLFSICSELFNIECEGGMLGCYKLSNVEEQ